MLAAPITAGQAQAVVQHWLAADPTPLAAVLPSQIAGVTAYGTAQAPAYFVVALSPTGYVIVAGDDRLEPIIAFAPKGIFDPSPARTMGALVSRDLPNRLAQLQALVAAASPSGEALNAVAHAQHKWAALLATGSTLAEQGAPSVSDPRVDPLTQTTWSQETANEDGKTACYNYYTPPYTAGTPANYPDGCVATAMAQLMRYWQYPTSGVGTASFPITINGEATSRRLRGGDGNGGPYQWANMPLARRPAPRRRNARPSAISVRMPGSR